MMVVKQIINLIRLGFSYILILPVRLYQIFISPVLPNSCRHVPTCSTYAIEALKIHGPIKGLYLGVRRILKCHPWGTHGYDPVPPKKEKMQNT